MSLARRIRVAVQVLAVVCVVSLVSAPTARAASPSPWLYAGECLQASGDPYGYSAPGSYLRSSNGKFTLSVTGTEVALLEPYNGTVGVANWTQYRMNQGAISLDPTDRSRLCMQPDGNLVLYTAAWQQLWASNTIGSGTKNFLWMQDDGNLAIYTSSWHLVWTSQTTRTLYVAGETMPSGTWIVNRLNSQVGTPVATMAMLSDGNLAIWRNGVLTWTSGTHVPGSRLVVQGDGNVGIYTPDNRAVWASWTQGANAVVMLMDCDLAVHVDGGGRAFGGMFCV